ncbi:VanZ family protein [Lactiplantibacillus sp. WILCCON 0030]|uniref:VanZ family protein n=1 Tax=Lactiplantibacillus brownii TaxID=3069269 RepID=A0ABU1AC59_9LACO|nr:VanZ family protein [Lactiplantibacillus brownii]MDQ7938501.1 VanZ family protein [Lactiplantibacillus brownii]
MITLIVLIISGRLWHSAPTKSQFFKRVILLAFLWVLAAFCYTPTSYNFSSGVQLPYIEWGPAKIIYNPIRQLDLGFWLNVLLTMPLGFLIGWNWPKIHWRRLILLGLITGLTLETGQFILDWLVHIDRWIDIDDVLTNWAGVVLGFGVYQFISRLPGFRWLQK